MTEEMNSGLSVPKKCFAMAFMRWLTLIALACATVACATEPKVVDHAFGFDATWDSPDVEVLDYRYGDSRLAGVRNPDWMLEKGKSLQAANTNGPMRVGDELYIKWRIKSSGEVHQDTVDLRSRLPRDITGYRIHFILKGPQLYVYLISPEKLDPNPCPSRGELRRLGQSDEPRDKIFSMYCYRKIITIYPDQPK